MIPEQRAAQVMALAAVLNATVAGMQAENAARLAAGQGLAYGEEAFQRVINNSGCHWNAVLTLLSEG